MPYPKIFRHSITSEMIYIDNATGTPSRYPYSWWLTQEPEYTYPSGATYLQYTEDGASGTSYWTDGKNQQALPDTFPTLGDEYIAKQSVYDIAYALYLITPTTLEAAQAIKYNELGVQHSSIQNGHIIYNTIGSGNQEFFSDNSTLQDLSSDLALFTPDGSVPLGYTIMNVSFINIICTLADLSGIVKLMQTLHYKCRINYDLHYAAIAALTTIENVMAYDVTTGWETIPFTSPPAP